MNWIQSQALNLVLPMILGSATSFLYQKVKKASAWIDERDAKTHSIITGAIAIVLPLVGKFIPGFTATDIGGIDPHAIQAILGLVAMQLTHKKLSA